MKPCLHKFTTTDDLVAAQNRVFRFTFSDSGVDRDGDRLIASGWDTSEYESNPVVLFSHDAEQPIGRASNVRVEKDRLVGDIEFADTEFADTIFELVKGGFLKAVSVGFMPIDYEYAKDRKAGINYTSQKLLEVSLVSVPANPRALIDDQPFGKLLRRARHAGIEVMPVVKWMTDKIIDDNTLPTERLMYKDFLNNIVDDDSEEEDILMAMTKAMKAAHEELKRLQDMIETLQKSVVTKADDDHDPDDEELKSVHLKIARMHVKMAKAFHAKAVDCHDEAVKCYNKMQKDEYPDEEKDEDADEPVDKDDEPDREDDNEEKRFAQIMARARAATR